MTAVHYKASYNGIGDMLRAEFMQAAMKVRAEAVADRARAIAPVDEDSPHRGRYRDSFEVSSGVAHRKTSRAYGRVTNVAPEALAVEFGTRNNPAHHTLVQALDGINYLVTTFTARVSRNVPRETAKAKRTRGRKIITTDQP